MQKHLFRIGFVIGLLVIAYTAIPILSQDDKIDLSNLPIGDGKVTTDEPQVGYVFSCVDQFGGGGAFNDGPWIKDDGTWDLTAKTAVVDGAVEWPSEFEFTIEGDTRVIIGNSLPNHPTGVYPVASNDDAYNYDRNPHTIEAIDFRLELPANPQIAASPSCTDFGAVGIMLTGSVYFNGLDALGRDAAAHEIQDACGGHPESTGQYHYHDLSQCIEAESTGEHSELTGYALDGFGIFGRYGENGETMTNADLDECHGHIHEIEWDGNTVEMYHYHATWEYPYIVGCYRGTPVVSPLMGMSGGGQQQGQQAQGQTGQQQNQQAQGQAGQQPPPTPEGGGGGQQPPGGGGGGGQPPGGGGGGQQPPPTPGGG